MICCHTPLKNLVSDYGDKYVLVTGNGSIMSVCESYGFTKAIHIEEVYALMPQISPLTMKEYPRDRQEQARKAVVKRLGQSETEILQKLKFDAFFVMADVFSLELNLQVAIDVLMS